MYGLEPFGGPWGGFLADLVRVPWADAMLVGLPAGVDPADVAARYDKGVLEVSVPVVVKPEGTRIPIQDADAMPEQPPDQAG